MDPKKRKGEERSQENLEFTEEVRKVRHKKVKRKRSLCDEDEPSAENRKGSWRETEKCGDTGERVRMLGGLPSFRNGTGKRKKGQKQVLCGWVDPVLRKKEGKSRPSERKKARPTTEEVEGQESYRSLTWFGQDKKEETQGGRRPTSKVLTFLIMGDCGKWGERSETGIGAGKGDS